MNLILCYDFLFPDQRHRCAESHGRHAERVPVDYAWKNGERRQVLNFFDPELEILISDLCYLMLVRETFRYLVSVSRESFNDVNCCHQIKSNDFLELSATVSRAFILF